MKKTIRTYLPTYEEAVKMCNTGKDPVFYENKYIVDNYNISVFNYRLAQFMDFVEPLKDNKEVNGYEMRGLTFVFNTNGSVYKRYLLLEKFFNLNQTTESMYEEVKDYKIKYVNFKEDGSVASFIRLPNGKVVSKSKMSFESDQALGTMRVYNTNEDVKYFVDYCLDNDITAVFEYVAPHNRIVLRYNKEELILLKLRNNKNGEHLDIDNFKDKLGSIKVPKYFKYTLDELVELCKTEEDVEGYVIQTVDEKGYTFFYKMKTEWYCERHGLLTNDLYREHVLIGYILDDKIDDILGQIPEEEIEARERIDKLINVVKHDVHINSEEINSLYKKYLVIKEENVTDHYTNKFFALKYRKNPHFSSVINMVKKGDTEYEMAKRSVRNKCMKLDRCRKWLMERDPSIFEYLIVREEE